MANSLVIANTIELLGGGVVSNIPQCAGAQFGIMATGGFDLSAPQPTADYVANLILDGERPYGRRASNRTIKLPVRIITPGVYGTDSQLLLAAAREVLEQAVDQDRWTLTWTRDGGLPLIIDCFRAQPSAPEYEPRAEEQGVMRLTLNIPALPYGRSDVQTRIAFAAPAQAAPAPPPAPVVLDIFSGISSTKHFQSPRCVVGPSSLCWDPDDDRVGDPGGQQSLFEYSSTLGYTQDLSGFASLQCYLGLGSRYHHCLEYPGHVHGVRVYVDLYDSTGNRVTAHREHMRLPVSPDWTEPSFSRISLPIPQGAGWFDYTSVLSYKITIANRHFPRRLSWVTCYVDNLSAQPPSVTANPVTRGALHTLHGVRGTARSPMSLQAIQPPSAGTPTVYTAAGVGSYTVPANTSWVMVEAIGGGGPGSTRTTAGTGGGGGAGEYARENIFPCSPGDQIPYSVAGAASAGSDGAQTVFGPNPSGGPLTVIANGGKAAPANSAAGGAAGSGSQNSVHYPGGAGRTASSTVSGGGGSSGGSSSPGRSPSGTAADTRTATGAGTFTCPAGVTQVYAECWAPGGSGATGSALNNGAGGGGGEYCAGYVNVTPGNTYNYSIGAGGAAVSGSAVNGNPGQATTWFTGDSGQTVTAHPGSGGSSRSYSGGGGSGGSGGGGAASVHNSGGSGGGAMPYSGGGGSSGGTNADGNAGDGYGNCGSAPTDGGGGGRGSGAGSGNGSAGAQPGGGGGGAGSSTMSGKGGDGKLRLTYPGGAPTSNGASAVTDGGAGGAGGSSPGSAGSAGQQPGGGGGGGYSSGTTAAGGDGGGGKLKITPYAPGAWNNLILHRPPLGAPSTLQPVVPVGSGADVPNGSVQYGLPQPVSGVNASFRGTYTVYLIASSWSGGSGSSTPRTITVTVKQWEYEGGPGYPVSTVPVSVAPNQVVNGLVCAGVVTLPVRQFSMDNTTGFFTVAVSSSNTADRFLDCLFLDTQGQTLVISTNDPGYVTYWADAPTPDTDLGMLLGSQADRSSSIGVINENTVLSGGPLHVEPSDPDNLLLAYSADAAAPNIAVSYYPAWYLDRLS